MTEAERRLARDTNAMAVARFLGIAPRRKGGAMTEAERLEDLAADVCDSADKASELAEAAEEAAEKGRTTAAAKKLAACKRALEAGLARFAK